jgi:hypothetical protein
VLEREPEEKERAIVKDRQTQKLKVFTKHEENKCGQVMRSKSTGNKGSGRKRTV